jgi:hypothetical protein
MLDAPRPPNSTATPLFESNARVAPPRAAGLAVGETEDQSLPVQIQVSFSSVDDAPMPPNRRMFPCWSVDTAASYRGEGVSRGSCRVHVDPSQVHVSPSGFPVASWPPKSTTVPETFAAMAAPDRAEGPSVVIDVHVTPLQAQVSPSVELAPRPPNNRVLDEAGTYESAAFHRAGGPLVVSSKPGPQAHVRAPLAALHRAFGSQPPLFTVHASTQAPALDTVVAGQRHCTESSNGEWEQRSPTQPPLSTRHASRQLPAAETNAGSQLH